MNKQEAIELLRDVAQRAFYRTGRRSVPIDKIVELVNQIHEPQKVVIPKFVAEWYERNKDGLYPAIYSTITGTYRKLDGENNDLLGTFEGWLLYEYNSILTLVQMHLFGYEIEQEQLYTVELFNGQPLVEVNNVLYFSSDLAASNVHVSKDKLESAGFGWVFECDSVKVVEWRS
ncbi:DUF1642 domain-containing protein [Streptococcus sp. VTCC 12905]|uniref:DUF1642 domain-containing protein n=1 Tax=Streptococcus sp. VTCC 12905 TaxID=3413768 RepID=UPI003D9C73FD